MSSFFSALSFKSLCASPTVKGTCPVSLLATGAVVASATAIVTDQMTKATNELNDSLEDEEELDEITTTGNIAGYDSPMAFNDDSKKSKKKKKKISTNSTGYNVVKEEINKKDERAIRKIVRKVVGNIFRDLWIKRSVWRNPSSND